MIEGNSSLKLDTVQKLKLLDMSVGEYSSEFGGFLTIAYKWSNPKIIDYYAILIHKVDLSIFYITHGINYTNLSRKNIFSIIKELNAYNFKGFNDWTQNTSVHLCDIKINKYNILIDICRKLTI